MKKNNQTHYLKITQSFSKSINNKQTTNISKYLKTIPLYINKHHITQPISKSIKYQHHFTLIFFFNTLIFHTNQYKPIK